MKNIKTFKLFTNDNEKSKEIEKLTKQKLISNGFKESDKYDIAIAIGGDGSFLRMMKNTLFNSDILYVGINTGTLGFAQEVSVDELDEFIEEIKTNKCKIEEIGIQKTRVVTEDDDSNFYSLNEIVIRDSELKTVKLNINIENAFLERFVGDGMLISTSFGSTAYNLSFGGSIVYNIFHTLQLTPIAPLNNRSYRNLLNSVVIPDNKKITLIPENKSLLFTVDGENKKYSNVLSIETYVGTKTIKCLRRKDYDFAKKINEKFLNN